MEDDTLNVVELKKIVNSRDYIDSFKNNTQALNFASYLKHINKSRIAAIDILEHYIPKKIYTKVLQYIRTPDTITTKILTPSKNGISLFTYSTDLSIRAGITFAMDFRPQVEAIAIPIVKQEFAGISEVQPYVDELSPRFTGRSHGCCGSYDGYCYYANYLCYAYDKLCTNCLNEYGDVTSFAVCFPKCEADR